MDQEEADRMMAEQAEQMAKMKRGGPKKPGLLANKSAKDVSVQ